MDKVQLIAELEGMGIQIRGDKVAKADVAKAVAAWKSKGDHYGDKKYHEVAKDLEDQVTVFQKALRDHAKKEEAFVESAEMAKTLVADLKAIKNTLKKAKL